MTERIPSTTTHVAPDALRVGLYVHLDLSWMQHPFPTSSFKIKHADQIERIRALGLQQVRIDPALSDALAPTPVSQAVATSTTEQPSKPPAEAVDTAEAAATARMAEHRAVRSACERELSAAVREVRSISRSFLAQPEQAGHIAQHLIEGLAKSLLAEADMAIHLMADKIGGEVTYHHALNTSLLAMLLARQMKAPAIAVQYIGLAALLHDIGKFDIPERIWRKTEPLNRAEQNWVKQHVKASVDIAQRMAMPPEALLVIGQHHELADGSGYPKQLKGDQISLLARIVNVANAYDNLCNPPNKPTGLTPYEALATLFGARQHEFDAAVLSTFVKLMGIYPPGTLVGLSDGTLGIVVGVNSAQPLKPSVLLYRPGVPKHAAIIIDLDRQPDLSIAKTFRPDDLDVEAFDYLAPRARVTYFFHSHTTPPEN